MRASCLKIALLFCILSLTTPFLYAQNEAIPITIITLPEKEQLIAPILLNMPPLLEKDSLEAIIASAMLDKKTEKDIGKIKSSFPAYLIPARQSITFAQSYKKANEVFLDFIDKRIYMDNLEKNKERILLREQWQKILGIDIWYPYFKAKEVEDWIGEKTKVELFHFKGRMRFENNQIKYTFKMRF